MANEMEIFLPEDPSLVEDLIEVESNEDIEDTDSINDTVEEDKDNKSNNTDTKEEDLLIEVDEDDEDKSTDKSTLPDKSKNKSNTNDSSNTISSFVNAFQEEGILNLEEGKEVNSLEDLYDAIQDEKEKYLQEQISSFPDKGYREALEAIKAGVPIDEVLGRQANVEKYSSIDDDNISAENSTGEALRKQILTDSFVAKGFTVEEATKWVKRSFDSGEDIEDAKKALNVLKSSEQRALENSKNQAKAQAKQAEINRVNAVKDFETSLKDIKEIIPGKKITPKRKKELFEGMTKGVDVIDGRPVDILNKFLVDGGTDARLFLSEIILSTNYGKNKDVLSTVKAKREATKILEKQLQDSVSNGFGRDDSTFTKDDDLWGNVI